MKRPFQKKRWERALVTGASSGIGEAFAKQLAAGGTALVLVARRKDTLDHIASILRDRHQVDVDVIAADLMNSAERTVVEERLAHDPPIDLLINNAGFGVGGDLVDTTMADAAGQIELNCAALVRLTRAALPGMIERGTGGVLNVSSLGGFSPVPHMSIYGATKAFVNSFTEGVHEEVRKHGVHVTALCPGFTVTEFQERSGYTGASVPKFLWSSADQVAKVGLRAIAHGRVLRVPGWYNGATAVFARRAPAIVTRKVSGMIGKE